MSITPCLGICLLLWGQKRCGLLGYSKLNIILSRSMEVPFYLSDVVCLLQYFSYIADSFGEFSPSASLLPVTPL